MRTVTTRRSARIAAMAAAGALALLSLTGCIKVSADMAVDSDAKGTGTLSFELQKEAAGLLGIASLDDFKTQVTSGDLSGGGLAELTDCDTTENDTGYVYACTFADQAFTDPSGIWTLAKEGNSIVFHMKSDTSGETDAQGDDALLGDASLGSVDVTVTFPGTITEMTGSAVKKTDDTTAQITGTLTSQIDVTVTSEAGGSGFAGTWAKYFVVIVGLLVLVLIVIVAILLIVRRRRPAAPTSEAEVVSATDVADTTDVVDATEVVDTTDVADATDVDAPAPAEAPTEVIQAVEESPAEAPQAEAPGDDGPAEPNQPAG